MTNWFKVAARQSYPGRWRAAVALIARDLKESITDHPRATSGWRWQLIKRAGW